MDILNYIDKMQEMYGDNPSSTVPGPRNMYSSGQLVQPSADGSRPGYADEKTILKAAGKELRELYNNDKLTKKVIELVKKEPDNYDSILKKINSYKGNKYKY